MPGISLRFATTLLIAALPSLASSASLTDGSAQSYCQTSPNSVGSGATIHWAGPVAIQGGKLVVAGLPRFAGGFFIYGVGVQQTPFGNGYSCFPGAKWILARKHASSDGTVVLNVQAEAEHEDLRWIQHGYLAGASWSFQYLYRDEAGGGAKFNLTDALLVQF